VIFGLNPFFIRSSIHPRAGGAGRKPGVCCLNPFFIRSSIHPVNRRGQGGVPCLHTSLNPFFIRSSIHPKRSRHARQPVRVSIPSSSGQVFIRFYPMRGQHRVECACLNPFFIRSSIHPEDWINAGAPLKWGLNPFFIRSSIHPPQGVTGGTLWICVCLNPFFIRSSIHP